MRIRIINPDYGVPEDLMKKELQILSRYTGKDVELSMVCLKETKVEIDSARDVVLAGPEILELSEKAEKEGCDAVVLYCFSDPAIEGIRESVRIPVTGGAEASMLYAMARGRSIGVLITSPRRISEKRNFLGTLGIDRNRLAGIESIEWQGGSFWEKREEAKKALIKAGKKLIKETHAEVIIPGCLSFLGLAEDLEKELKVPVIDPAVAAVSMAESLVRMG